MKKFILNLLTPILGRKSVQGLFINLYYLSLKGMNYGTSGDYAQNGELNVLNHIQNRLGSFNQPIIFDVGANVGGYAKLLSEQFPKGTIHAFEPSKLTFQKLTSNLASHPNIIPNNFGLSNVPSNQLLYSNYDTSGFASVYKRNLDHYGIEMGQSEEITLSTIDQYCAAANIDHIHFLKLDIEGHEVSALTGGAQMLNEKRVDFIQFEFGGCNIDSRTYFRDFYLMLKDNYRIYRIIKNGLAEITEYKETNELFVNTNYLAEKRV